MEVNAQGVAVAVFEGETKNFLKYRLEEAEDNPIVGRLYLVKDMFDGRRPEKVTIVVSGE
jgi:hypothetical protein